MTVLGGVVGSSADLPKLASAILAAQRAYGAHWTHIQAHELAALGASSEGSIAANARWLLVADVRLDNRADLLARMGIDPSRAAGDAAILLEAWSRWGEDALQHVLGDFALAVHDRERRTLTLARDATGQRPLFYKQGAGATAFASMPAALARTFHYSGPNLLVLARHQANLQHRDPQSFFEGVERVMPGEIVRVAGARIDRRLHWQPIVGPGPGGGSEDYVEAYRSLLDSAVAARLAGCSGPIGCHLSSGYDSSAVTGTAARLVDDPGRITAFTSAPLPGADSELIRHRFADESALAAETARMHGVHHVVIRETAPLFDVVEHQTVLMQAPQLSPFNLVWWTEIRRRAAELGIDTILTGEIGNLSLNASGLRTLTSLVANGDWRRWWREARLAVRRSDIRWRGVLMTSFAPWLPAGVSTRIRQAFLGVPPPEELSFLRSHWHERLKPEMKARPLSSDPYRDRLEVIRLNDLGLHRKAAAADGVEERDAMSDRRLIEFSLRLPHDQLLRDGQPRPLARAALADRIPRSVLDMQVRGMQGTDWHLRISQQAARDVLEAISAHPLAGELLDLSRLRAAIDRWPTGDWNSYRTFRTYRDGVTGALAIGIFLTSFEAMCGQP